MSMIMYKTNTVDDIEKVDVIRETEHTVWIIIPGDRKASSWRKRSSSWNFFETFDEAKQFIVEKYEKTINQLEQQLSRKRKQLDKILNLKEDEY